MTDFPTITPQGVDGFVIRFSDRLTDQANRAAIALARALERGAVPGVEEAASALTSVSVRASGDPKAVRADLQRLLSEEGFENAKPPDGRRLWHIPAAFGGPALSQCAASHGWSEEKAIADLVATRVRVMAIGFAPGQPYLGPLGPAWDVPRLADLVDVTEGTLAVAIRQMVMFTAPSPTGWGPVGQTAFRCFRPEADAPFPLSPGDEIAFEAVSMEKIAALRDGDTTGNGGARAETLS